MDFPFYTTEPPSQKPERPFSKETASRKRLSEPTPGNRRLAIISATALVIAAIGVLFGVGASLQAQRTVETALASPTSTLVAKSEIPKGSTITADMLESANVPSTYRVSGAYAESEEAVVIGQRAGATINAGAQITPSLIAGNAGAGSLTDTITPGMFGVSIGVDAERGVANLLQVGDQVRIIQSASSSSSSGTDLTSTLCDSARVIALDASLAETPESYVTVTVEVSAEDLLAIVRAQNEGTVTLGAIAAVQG